MAENQIVSIIFKGIEIGKIGYDENHKNHHSNLILIF